MVKYMKRNYFYLFLFFIYILFLSKDTLLRKNNTNNIKEYYCTTNEINDDYQELLKLVNLEQENNLVISKIIRRNMYSFYDLFTILKGTKEGIKVGDAVINEQGLIGIINKVYDNYSEVKLISSPSSKISVKINNSYGILVYQDNKFQVLNLKLNEEIRKGDLVYTSGLTNIKDGILVGKVKKVTKDKLELEYITDLEDINLISLKYVGVITE